MITTIVLLLAAADPAHEGWEESSRKDGVVIYTRKHAGTDSLESLGVSAINAPPWVVKNAIDDVEKSDDMPYLKESRIIRQDARGSVIYHRTAPPFVTDRDYT